MPTIEIHVPTAATRIHDRPLAPRLRGLDGARIGWVDNLKANAGELLRGVSAAWRDAGHQFDALTLTKNATAGAPANVMAHLRTCDAVVMAIAD